jgi:leader peptidase (prepilin peptidase)/N-methyltransferase
MTIIIFFILGLIAGSFLNVVVCRLHTAESFILGRSHCPQCKSEIRWYDNIPLASFVLLKGNCRDCRQKISWQYPLVEFFTGLVFILIGYKFFDFNNFSSWITALYYCLISGALIIILVYDFLYLEIPTAVVWISAGLALIFNLFFDWQIGAANNIFDYATTAGILAAVIAAAFFLALSLGSREKWMGMGDAYLAFILGLFLGWPEIFLALFLSFFIGSAYGLVLIILKKKSLKSQIPFAPFLILGTFLTLFFYEPIINWYLSLFY